MQAAGDLHCVAAGHGGVCLGSARPFQRELQHLYRHAGDGSACAQRGQPRDINKYGTHRESTQLSAYGMPVGAKPRHRRDGRPPGLPAAAEATWPTCHPNRTEMSTRTAEVKRRAGSGLLTALSCCCVLSAMPSACAARPKRDVHRCCECRMATAPWVVEARDEARPLLVGVVVHLAIAIRAGPPDCDLQPGELVKVTKLFFVVLPSLVICSQGARITCRSGQWLDAPARGCGLGKQERRAAACAGRLCMARQ
jgi:hypothetical protein